MSKYGYGVDLGGTTVKLGLFKDNGELLEKWEIPTDKTDNGANILSDIAKSIEDNMAKNGIGKEVVIGVGIDVPGPVTNGVVNKCANLGWGVFSVEESLGQLVGMPVKCINDANAAALGELWMGGGKGTSNMVMITLGTGVGGGVVIDGKVIDGSHGAGGEVGHMPMNPDETIPCGCGNCGCYEQYVSATGLVRMTKEYIAQCSEATAINDLPEITAKDVWDLAKAGDKAAVAITDKYCDILGRGAAFIAAVSDPEVIVIGGGVSKAGAPLVDKAHDAFMKYAFHGCRTTRFELAKLGNDAGIYGSMYMLM